VFVLWLFKILFFLSFSIVSWWEMQDILLWGWSDGYLDPAWRCDEIEFRRYLRTYSSRSRFIRAGAWELWGWMDGPKGKGLRGAGRSIGKGIWDGQRKGERGFCRVLFYMVGIGIREFENGVFC
jgi:hypothetical protein